MYECAYYASVNNKSLLHFTVSQEHQSQFENIVKSSVKYKKKQIRQ
jgi:hypothetical protein